MSSELDVYFNYGHAEGWRYWEDAVKYNFICAGGGPWFSKPLRHLNPRQRIWVYAPHHGYVGVARMKGSPQSAAAFKIKTPSGEFPALKILRAGKNAYHRKYTDLDHCEYFVPVQWFDKVSSLDEAVYAHAALFSNRSIVCQPNTARWRKTVEYLKKKVHPGFQWVKIYDKLRTQGGIQPCVTSSFSPSCSV